MQGPADRTTAHWFVSGRVQGVGFRYHVMRVAGRLDVRGDVRNLSDGRVEIRAQGSPEAIAALLDEVKIGPALAEVTSVEVGGADERWGFLGFDLRH